MNPNADALRACELLKAVHAGTLLTQGEINDSYHADGVDALLVTDRRDGRRWLLLPGTGYGGGFLESVVDWVRNVVSALPCAAQPPVPPPAAVANVAVIPVPGESGRLWGRGFLRAADALCPWLDKAMPGVACSAGYSQGGAIMAILAWSRPDIKVAHAIAPARSSFSGPQRCDRLQSWVSADDLVPRVPLGASHVGPVNVMPGLGLGPVAAHCLAAYRRQIALHHA